MLIDARMSTSGGGFSFQQSILQALLACHTNHNLYLFCSDPNVNSNQPHVTVVTTAKQRPLGPMGRIVKVSESIRGRVYRRIGREFETPIKRLIKKYGIEMLWFPTPVDEEVNVPYIYTLWDLQHRTQPFFPEVGMPTVWRRTERMYRNMVPRASIIITGTSVGKKEIVKYYGIPEERIHVVPLPVPEIPVGQDDSLAITQSCSDRKYLFYPAQFWPHKNHVALLRALKILNNEFGLDFDLILTGSDQGNLSYVRSVTDELGLKDNVRFLGFVERASMSALYRGAFALVFPSLFGPDNLPPLEAFVLGCPVIAGAIPGTEEQLGEAALLVDPRDERAIAEAVSMLNRNPKLRQRLVENGFYKTGSLTANGYVMAVMRIIDEFGSIRRCWSA